MTADRWTQQVRNQLGLGRILALGGPRDGAWITEAAAGAVLRRAMAREPGARLVSLRIALADPQAAGRAAVERPPSALPPGPLRVSARLAAIAAQPLPATAERVRRTLAGAARELGLAVAEVDLRVTELLDGAPAGAEAERPVAPRPAAVAGDDTDEVRAAEAVRSVPGVDCLTAVLGRPVHIGTHARHGSALPQRHVRVEFAAGGGRPVLEVARDVRAAVRDALPDRPTAAVLVTSVG
ncbi:nucleopolyhedrovirus P10 family protein [Streptomyces sp. MS06]|uniref:nucleopolyhedrovirus P10 family protein n=1 Tax=Streptomyces sp. MS06 TaxID=3385974 RepID=UPI0039A1504B